MSLSLYDLNNNKAGKSLATTTADGLMSKEDKTKLNGIADNANNYTHPVSHPVSMITGLASVSITGNYNDLINKPIIPTSLPAAGGNADTVDGKHADEFAMKIHGHNLADESIAGFMSTSDKIKLNNIAIGATKVENSVTNGNIKINGVENNVYTHPENHSVDMITGFANVATSGDYNDLVNLPESLPANGGNADTIGGKSPSDFAPSNFGLGTEAFDVSGQNTNNIFYKGLNLNNSCQTGPSRSMYLMVIRHSDTYIVQIGYDYDGNGSYIRFNVNGTWTSWNRQTYGLASVVEDGLMSAADKTKLEQLVIKVAELEAQLNTTN